MPKPDPLAPPDPKKMPKQGEGEEKSFSKKMRDIEEKQKAKSRERRNPFTLLQYFMWLWGVPLIAMAIDLAMLLLPDVDAAQSDLIHTICFGIYGSYMYFLLSPILFATSAINLFVEFTPDIASLFSIKTENFKYFLSSDPSTFFTLINSAFSEHLSSVPVTEAISLGEGIVKLYLFSYIFMYIFYKLAISPLILNRGFAKAYNDYTTQRKKYGKTPAEIAAFSKKTGELFKILLSQKARPTELSLAYKQLFEERDAVLGNIIGGRLFKMPPTTFEFFSQINEIFDKNIPNHYYNIINFMDETDMKILYLQKTPFKDSFTQTPYTPASWAQYVLTFGNRDMRFIVPFFIATLRQYRTFDIHNFFQTAAKLPHIELHNRFPKKDEFNKIKRLSKEGYKILGSNTQNFDTLNLSIQLRYPFSFSFAQIEELELAREDIATFAASLRLKYLGGDDNMKIYNIQTSSVNHNVKEYLTNDLQTLHSMVIDYSNSFFTIAANSAYEWLRTSSGLDYIAVVHKIIQFNFNATIFLSNDWASLNATHFKNLYFIEDKFTNQSKAEVTKLLASDPDNLFSTEFFNKDDDFCPDAIFFKTNNTGFFEMLDLASDYLGTSDSNTQIRSFLSEFVSISYDIKIKGVQKHG